MSEGNVLRGWAQSPREKKRQRKIKISKKIRNDIDSGLWTYYGHPDDDYMAIAIRQPETDGYLITYHHGEVPAFKTKTFKTLAELETAMRELEPDLRKWRTKFE